MCVYFVCVCIVYMLCDISIIFILFNAKGLAGTSKMNYFYDQKCEKNNKMKEKSDKPTWSKAIIKSVYWWKLGVYHGMWCLLCSAMSLHY